MVMLRKSIAKKLLKYFVCKNLSVSDVLCIMLFSVVDVQILRRDWTLISDSNITLNIDIWVALPHFKLTIRDKWSPDDNFRLIIRNCTAGFSGKPKPSQLTKSFVTLTTK